MYTDFVIRHVKGYGFLPIKVDADGKEVFRGSFYRTLLEAAAALEALA
ncbi:MAG: hypothetical protein H9535_03615 [Ignavibacteria bacterium]|nr:hypothetical protein [Ignavibacteria bacterium]